MKKHITADDLKVGQYVQFSMGYENDSDVLFRIVDIHPETNHILVLDIETNMYNWERIEYIEKVFEVKELTENDKRLGRFKHTYNRYAICIGSCIFNFYNSNNIERKQRH